MLRHSLRQIHHAARTSYSPVPRTCLKVTTQRISLVQNVPVLLPALTVPHCWFRYLFFCDPLADLEVAWENSTDLQPSPVSTIIEARPATARTVVLIDPLSTGVLLQERLFDAGYRIILVWSERTQPATREKHYERTGHPVQDFEGVVVHDGKDINTTLSQIVQVTTDIHAVMCGSEFSVLLEDHVAEGLNDILGTNHLKSSGMAHVPMKVDKYLQANAVRQVGLDAICESLAHSEGDVRKFLTENSDGQQDEDVKFVVKPQTGAGSVGVTFCESKQAVVEAFRGILNGEHKAKYGSRYQDYKQELSAGVLLQEYLDGTEYIVNSVVRNGEIKTTAMFKYDKRPYNGAGFVCFSKELVVPSDDPDCLHVIEYTEKVLKAIGLRNGAIHAEVMHVQNRGPVLVEVNCRLHGGNAAWVRPANACMGYDQLSVMMDVYLHNGEKQFEMIPSRPMQATNRCYQVKMRSHIEGTLECVIKSQLFRIISLPSYSEHFFSIHPGDRLLKTVDMPSVPGEVTLIHTDKEILDEDYNTLNDILSEGIFQVYAEEETL